MIPSSARGPRRISCTILPGSQSCHAEFVFQIPDLPAQGRLRYVKPRRRARHVLFFRDGNEVAQMAEFHSKQAYALGMVSQATKYFLPTRSEDMLHR